MPVGMKTIISDRAKNKGQEINVKSYYFEKGMKPLAVIYGCFSPFTGANGHGRLLEAAKQKGINDFLIVIPGKTVSYDDDRNMFNNKQKLEIAMKGATELGYNVVDGFVNSTQTDPYRLLRGIAEHYPNRRIVMVCGPDRAEDYSKYCVPYSKNYVASLDDGKNEASKFEYIVLKDRGASETSGTKVRQAIRDNDEKEFINLTGYSHNMWEWLRKMATENKENAGVKVDLNQQITKGARKGIKHLYNPGNAAELDALGFLDLVKELNKTKGILENEKNISITEKADGTSFCFGIDNDGNFFTMKSNGAPRYSANEIINRCLAGTEQKQGKAIVTIDAMNTAKIFKKLETNKKIQAILKSLAKKYETIKITAEMLLTGSGMINKETNQIRFVGTNYDIDKLGTFGTLVIINVTDVYDNPIPNANSIIEELCDCTTDELKIENTKLENVKPINISNELKTINKEIKKIDDALKEQQGLSIEEVLSSKDRSKNAQALKKSVKTEINGLQKILNDVLDNVLSDIGGKWGEDYEGRVFKLANGQMVKITSDKFKEFKSKHSLDFLDNKTQPFIGDWNKELDSIKENTKMKNFTEYLVEQTNPILTEKFVGNDLVMYNSSKDESFERFFFDKSLRFANNAGNMYGLGIYTVLELPKDSGTSFSDKVRNNLYGSYVYELKAPSDKFFYFLYDYFVKSELYSKLGKPTEQEYIKKQFEYFDIQMPTDEELEEMTPSETIRPSSAAFKFYKYMHNIYYQRKDGTLNCPITGFVYFGKNDGYVGVVWAPYRCKLTRKLVDGKWKKIKDYNNDESELDDVEARIFDGHKTEEKEYVYRLLQAYRGENVPIGNIVNICIHDDKTFDFTFKANNPQADAYRHCYLIIDNKYMDKILSMGYRIGTLDGWVKMGDSTQAKETRMYLPSEAPKDKLPMRVTEGIYLTGMPVTDKEIAACKRIKIGNGSLVIRKSEIFTDDLGFENVELKDCIVDDDCYDTILDKYKCIDDKGELRIIKKSEYEAQIAEKEAAKKAKEEAKRLKEEEKQKKAEERARKAAEKEAKIATKKDV